MTNRLQPIKSLLRSFVSPIIKLLTWVTQPAPSVKNVADRRKAQLTSGLSLAMALISAAGFFAAVSVQGNNMLALRPQSISLVSGIVFSLLSYILSRTRFHRLGTLILVITYLFSGFYLALFASTNPSHSLLTTIPLSYIMASVLLTNWEMVMLTVIVTGLTFLVPYINPAGLTQGIMASTAGQFMTWGVLFLIVNSFRNAIERDRLGESEKMNLQLQILQTGLEDRIRERTRELNLASELGQVLSQVRKIDSLLSQAVKLIQERFSLYYAQIYLTDLSGKELVLQAGSGRLGDVLKQRGHRFEIDTTSLNGRAAFEKKPVVMSDVEKTPGFRPNPLLPETRSEICYPLIIGDRVVGVLDIQSNKPGELNDRSLPAYKILTGQLAIAIDNANLYEQSVYSAESVSAQSRQSTREGWSEYLNAIDKEENLRAAYSRGDSQPLPTASEQPDESHLVEIPIMVTGEQIGTIEVEYSKDHNMLADEHEFAESVANQVARQVENLRLLAQAERYRLETEKMLRQTVHQGWQNYLDETSAGELAVAYDQNQVKTLDDSTKSSAEPAIIEKIKVQDEIIGELVVSGIDKGADETQELLSSVSEQLSAHLENLRLADQTRKALELSKQQASSLSMLNELAAQLSSASSIIQVLQVSGQQTRQILNSEYSAVALVTSEADTVELYTVSGDDDGSLPVGRKMPLAGSLFGEVITQNKGFVLPDDGPMLGSQFRDVQANVEMGIQTIISAPLVVGGRVVGSLNTGTTRSVFTENEHNIFNQVVLLVGNALENRNLLERTQLLAQRERSLRQITSRVRSYTDPETILRTAAHELGVAIGRKVIIQLAVSNRGAAMQGWQEFQDAANLPVFFYDGNSVLRVNNSEAAAILAGEGNGRYRTTPLALRDIDQIGLVGISNEPAKPLSEDDQVFIEQIAEQVALALESARLFTQTQRALAETDALYTIISELNAARDYNMILSVLAQRTILASADQSVVMFMFDHALGKDNVPDWIIPVAQHSAKEIHLAERYPLNAFEVNPNTLFTNAPVTLEKVMEDGRLDRITQTLFHDVFHASSSIILPMLLGDQSLGFILGNFGESRTFTEAEIQRLATITSQVAIAVQGMQLLEQTLTRAKREQLLREVTNQVNTASGTDEILRRAAEQVGRALKRPVFVYLGNSPDRYLEKTVEEDYGTISPPSN